MPLKMRGIAVMHAERKTKQTNNFSQLSRLFKEQKKKMNQPNYIFKHLRHAVDEEKVYSINACHFGQANYNQQSKVI